ncbi:hypothetical protein [Pseudomonas huanghezhanensis]|uniref:hypothetical protein n=1 Tax=Pseudomonas huanghezhanensis TaxID=3002903 RepID=UPI002285E5CA|nr:hypothetical protein [Pseudomonas sp. BSw22131]
MSIAAQVVTFEVEDRETATVELEYAISIETPEIEVITAGEQGPPGINAADISSDPNNRLTFGSDQKLYVSDDLSPDPLNYYILAKG